MAKKQKEMFEKPVKGTLAYTRAVSTRKAAIVFLAPVLLFLTVFIGVKGLDLTEFIIFGNSGEIISFLP